MSTENVHKTKSYSQPMRGGMYVSFFPMMPVGTQLKIEMLRVQSVERGQGHRVGMKRCGGRQQMTILTF